MPESTPPKVDEEPVQPDMIVSLGDCEMSGACAGCGKHFGVIRPNQSLDVLGQAWERHLMLDRCST